MYRRVSDFSKYEMEEILTFLAKNRLGNIHIISAIENRDPESSLSINRGDNGILGLVAMIKTPEYPLLLSVGEIPETQVVECFNEEDRFLLISDRIDSWSKENRWEDARVYEEFLMSLNVLRIKGSRHETTRLLAESDSEAFLSSFEGEYKISDDNIRRSEKFLRDNDCVGLFIGGRIVSRVRVQARTGFGWVIGGLYTLEAYRKRGYATSVMSRIVEHALEHTDTVALFVRKGNVDAIRLYNRIGFNIAGNRFFIDYKTGQF